MSNVFAKYDALLDDAQRDHFADSLTINGVEVAAIEDESLVFMGEVQSSSAVWTVETKLLPAEFGRGYSVVLNGVEYAVSRIHPKDGANTLFELER